MSKIDVAYYIGDQDIGNGHTERIFNILVKDGLRDVQKNVTYAVKSTILERTLKRIVPNLVIPSNITSHRDPTGTIPPSMSSIAFAIV